MFEIHSETDLYKTYFLHDRSSDSVVAVVPERGGIVTEVRVGDRQCLYLDRDRFNNPELSVRGGIPILFPICGNMPDNQYTWDGKTYTMAQHGFARTLPWTVTATNIEGAASITLTLTDTPETLAIYPFQFQFQITYSLSGTALSIDSSITNQSLSTMPFILGYHPYFSAIDKSTLSFTLPSQTYFDQANDVNGTCDGSWNFDLDEIDAVFDAVPAGKPSEAIVVGGEHPVEISCSQDFLYWVFWTLKPKPFYCLEPWSGPRNSLNTGEDRTDLAAGSTHTSSVKLAFSA